RGARPRAPSLHDALPPLTLGLQAGHYDLDAAAGDSYSDWLVSLDRDFGPINARLQYTDTSSYSELVAESVGDSRLADGRVAVVLDRKSTRLNSSHVTNAY